MLTMLTTRENVYFCFNVVNINTTNQNLVNINTTTSQLAANLFQLLGLLLYDDGEQSCGRYV
jgi:hypothetical protein